MNFGMYEYLTEGFWRVGMWRGCMLRTADEETDNSLCSKHRVINIPQAGPEAVVVTHLATGQTGQAIGLAHAARFIPEFISLAVVIPGPVSPRGVELWPKAPFMYSFRLHNATQLFT